jgi:hypothetical protein
MVRLSSVPDKKEKQLKQDSTMSRLSKQVLPAKKATILNSIPNVR